MRYVIDFDVSNIESYTSKDVKRTECQKRYRFKKKLKKERKYYDDNK